MADDSPLDGPAVNAGVRVGMLMRLHRFCEPGGRFPRQADLLQALRRAGCHATPTALSRVESGAIRSSRLLRGYEEVLGLEDGALRAVSDHLTRAQPSAPGDREPIVEDLDVHALSALTARVLESEASGSDWYAFGRAFRRPDSRGMPVPMMRESVDRLCAALQQGAGLPWVMQLEALLLLAEGPYGDLVPAPPVGRAPGDRRASTAGRAQSRPDPAPSRTKDRRNQDWTWSHRAAHALAERHRLPELPVLARVLYDVLADPDDARALDAGITLAAVPFADEAVSLLREGGQRHPDRAVRLRTARRLEEGWARPGPT
ncbi:MAG: hypothetical protein ACTHNS_12845 [Marmoricola sp.]